MYNDVLFSYFLKVCLFYQYNNKIIKYIMIIDCFNFYNEIEILHLRLDYLYDIVDKFVIVESLDSHSKKVRKEKYVFEENIDKFQPYMDKIMYYKINDLPYNTNDIDTENDTNNITYAWKNKNFQKNYCSKGIEDLECLKDGDWILFSDVDEIPNKDILKDLCYYDGVNGIRFVQKLFYYNVNVLQNQLWGGTIGIQKKYFTNMMYLRDNRDNEMFHTFQNGGWHYSYMGGVDKVYLKMQSYAESDKNIQYCNLDNIKKSIDTNCDLFERMDDMFIKNIVDISQPNMAPSNINKILELYPYLLKKEKEKEVHISYVCLIYKSTKWLQFVYEQLLKFTNLEGNEFFFIANDAHPSVLEYLKDKDIPHYIHNNTEEQKKEWYINNVYRAYNYGGRMAKGKYIIFINSDMAFTPNWSEKMVNSITNGTCITSRLVERGILSSGTYGIEKNFGDNYNNYKEQEFIEYAQSIEENVLKDEGLFMPLLLQKTHFEQVNGYPEGNIIVGSDIFNPVYATPKDDLISGDRIFMKKLESIGVYHKTNFSSIVYHFQQGEMLEEIPKSVVVNANTNTNTNTNTNANTNIGWLVNDTLTCIPGTKTFWHFLLENIEDLVDKTNGYTTFDNLPNNIENDLQHTKPKYIIRNATYFRNINTDTYTISILQDNHIKNLFALTQQIDVLNNTNLTIANSKYVYDAYKQYITNDYRIIPLGTNFKLFKPVKDRNPDILPNSILYIGSSMVYPKGFDRLLRIVNEMPEQNFCFIMKDNFTVEQLPLYCQKRVKIFNSITEKEIVPIINSCAMGICTSYEETQHLGGIEICACNKPMVATKVGWYYDLCDTEEWGVLANDTNFVEKINYVMSNLDNFSPRECLIERGYTMYACKKGWLDVIKNIK